MSKRQIALLTLAFLGFGFLIWWLWRQRSGLRDALAALQNRFDRTYSGAIAALGIADEGSRDRARADLPGAVTDVVGRLKAQIRRARGALQASEDVDLPAAAQNRMDELTAERQMIIALERERNEARQAQEVAQRFGAEQAQERLAVERQLTEKDTALAHAQAHLSRLGDELRAAILRAEEAEAERDASNAKLAEVQGRIPALEVEVAHAQREVERVNGGAAPPSQPASPEQRDDRLAELEQQVAAHAARLGRVELIEAAMQRVNREAPTLQAYLDRRAANRSARPTREEAEALRRALAAAQEVPITAAA